MYIVDSYSLAVIFCIITMLGWGSWANTLKMTPSKWEFPLYYWDYSIGLVLTTLLFGFTFGSTGTEGRSFLADISQADSAALTSAFIGGVIFNLSNLLIVAAIAVAGLAVAFPVGVGLALVIGVIVNYIKVPEGQPVMLFGGVLLVVLAIIINGVASAKVSKSQGSTPVKGILLSVFAGIIMGFFYRFVADSMTFNFAAPEAGKLTPYSAMFVFTVGVFISSFVFNTWFMFKPISGKAVTFALGLCPRFSPAVESVHASLFTRVFAEKTLDATEHLRSLLRSARRQKRRQQPRIVEAKVRHSLPRNPHREQPPELSTRLGEADRRDQQHAPRASPSALDQPPGRERVARQGDEVRRRGGHHRARPAVEERLVSKP